MEEIEQHQVFSEPKPEAIALVEINFDCREKEKLTKLIESYPETAYDMTTLGCGSLEVIIYTPSLLWKIEDIARFLPRKSKE